jgi:hypothetical protein
MANVGLWDEPLKQQKGLAGKIKEFLLQHPKCPKDIQVAVNPLRMQEYEVVIDGDLPQELARMATFFVFGVSNKVRMILNGDVVDPTVI